MQRAMRQYREPDLFTEYQLILRNYLKNFKTLLFPDWFYSHYWKMHLSMVWKTKKKMAFYGYILWKQKKNIRF